MSEQVAERKLSRRTFFKHAGGVAAGAATATIALPALKEVAKVVVDTVGSDRSESVLMYDDLQRALQKPMAERKWAMVIDIRKCIGCSACTAACIAENNLPPGVTYRTVAETEDGEYPEVRRFFMPANCMQCERAPCIEAANKVIPNAMSRRPDGIVVIDYKKMKGKKVFEAASNACPYPKSLWYDEGKNYTDGTPAIQPYEKRTSKEYGRYWTRKETRGTTRKCHFCTQRIDAGVLPACVTTCTGQAMHFGDVNDEESLVSKLLRKSKSVRMNLASGAEPSIFYLDDDPEQTCMMCHS
jgi:Fe-S-cluster-containing dehydrogenase component